MPKITRPESPCLLFLPVSGHEGSGEFFRCLSIARAAHSRWPESRIHFALSRNSRFLGQVPFETHLLESSPTNATAQVNRLLARLQPDVAIYDSAGRVAQLATARRLGARTVYVSSRSGARRAGFRLRRMRWLDQHWSAEAPFLSGGLSRLERLKLKLVPKVAYVPVGVMFDSPQADIAARLRDELRLVDALYAVFCPGGGGRFEHAPEAPEVFASAAREFARLTGARAVVVDAGGGEEARPPEGAGTSDRADVLALGPLPNAELMALLHGASVAAVNGGSLMLQALALGVPAVAVPIAGDQPARIAACAGRGAVTSAPLDPSELAKAAADLYHDRPRQAEQRAVIATLGLDNGLPRAMNALGALLEREEHDVGGSTLVRRRDFLRVVATAGAVSFAHATGLARGTGLAREPGRAADGFFIPMDAGQPEPLRAYGIVYRTLRAGGSAEWLLNHRGGAFLVHHPPALDEALARGVWTETLAETAANLEADLASGSTRAMRLEVAPTIAVYAPPYAAPWDDAVRLALEYAEIPYTTVWDRDLLGPGLAEVDWLHLHHEDFTGQYGKYGRSVQETDWYRAAVALDAATAAALGFGDAPALKAAVAAAIRGYVRQGGFVFAMCAATETLDVALAGAPLDYDATLAFTGFTREAGSVGPFSTIDGHRVNTPDRLPLDAVAVQAFAPLIDPVAAMLTQNHRTGFPDWYGLTTSFRADQLKPGVTVLATCGAGRLAKYLHGDFGEGTFTFLGGHDPEDFQHAIGDPPTALKDHPQSPGYRLILNNVLFPAAEDERRRT